ncbi:outer membrane lipoprotein carrier protein LolA [Flavihumibacter rivuli]|uniref:LolA family protein n=1 Tax=Flavihumibacter rivuli TaxID=2838156 RepID=UPI001EFA9DFA|nr:outer membrane lipoprotein carrier protein LolA [Flavihumibacter rivuli]ULQ56737.1 outer membrane lipoprotein carrier protein LolA [Flavihumibacter rivuli]
MKKTLGILALVAGSLMAGSVSAQSDPAAKAVLDGVSAKFKTFSAVQSSFTLQVEDGKGKVQGVKKGTVYMKGTKYRVSITGQEIFCDGKNIWTYDKAANEVTITKFDPSQNTITPQKLFTNFYDKDFLYKLNGEKKVAGKVIQEIEMTPIDKSKAFHKVYVYVDKASKTIYSTKVLEKNGNKYTYTVNSLNGKAQVADSQFVFDKKKYPGVEEVDLR